MSATMQMDEYNKDHIVDQRGLDEDHDSDVQQMPGRNYDPAYGEQHLECHCR